MRVGVAGLGRMGLAMAARLSGAGHAVSGADPDPERRRLAAAAGVAARGTLDDLLAEAPEALLLSLPDGAAVEAVARAALAGSAPAPGGPRLLLDASTSEPGRVRRLAEAASAAGRLWLDAPVSGGPAGAAAGTLTVMAGGEAAALSAARPLLDALAARVLHLGPAGAGQAAKLVNNLLVAGHLALAGEALRLALAAGLEGGRALEAVNASSGRSAATEAMLPRWVLGGGFDSGFPAGLMRKDLRLALGLAGELGLDLPLAEAAGRLWEGGPADGEDFSRIADPSRREGVSP